VTGLRLVAAAPTPALRRARFGGDDDLDDDGRNAALALRPTLPRTGVWVSGPSRAARQTARALGGEPADAPGLADIDHGTWTGRTPDDLAAADPAALHAWLTDPGFAPPGGESLAAARRRAGAWLDAHAGRTLVAVAHPAVVRCALAHALHLPAAAVWQLDVAPLAVLHLTHRAGRWHLHLPRG
jgi:broad specificity phosphatase PhoE